MNKLISLILSLLFATSLAKAAIVTFTGGTANLANGEIIINDAQSYNDAVMRYQEGDVILDYLSPNEDWSSQTGHGKNPRPWSAISSIEIYREGNTPFDLQFFHLTSNTEIGRGAATGEEIIAIQGWLDGAAVTEKFQLPSKDWGGEYQDIFLPSSFDNVDKVVIRDLSQWTTGEYVQGEWSAFSFGMNNFVFDEVVPQELIIGNSVELKLIPELSSSLLGGLGLLLLLQRKRR
jgi:hypothetical protein